MACTNCGQGAATAGYTVRFESTRGDGTEMDLVLCRDCAEEFRAEGGVVLEHTGSGDGQRER
jgi:hypothetical protein